MTRILQISDLHIMPEGRLFRDTIDTAAALQDMLAGLSALLHRLAPVERIVVTGDLTECGSAAAYRHVMSIMENCPLPWCAIPGNHDSREAMRAGLRDAPWMPAQGPINWREDLADVTILGLDTLVEGADHGALSDATMAWLEDTLRDLQHRPVLIFMHHPPVRTGVSAMDAIGLARNPRFEAALRKHDGQLQIACGHVHRMMIGQFAGRQITIAPGTSHAVGLNLHEHAEIGFVSGLSGAILHELGSDCRTHLVSPEDFVDPVRFG